MTIMHNLTKALFLTILFASASAYAAPKGAAKPAANSDANEAVRRGVELLAKKDYVGALAAFREAREIAPTAMTAAQIAFVHIGMEHWLEAYNELADVLEESDDAWVSAHQAQLKESRAMLEKHIGSLRVWGTPEGAHVKLDGEVLGLLPMRSPVQVVAGRGTVVVQMTGYQPAQRFVEIKPGETAEVVVLLHPVATAPSASPLPAAPAPSPRAPAFQPTSAQTSPAFAEHLRDMHTYRWVGLLTGTVLLGASIPSFVWLKTRDHSRPLTTKENALTIAASTGVALGSCGMVMGIMSWIYLGLNEPASPAHAGLGSPYLMMGGRF